MVAVIFSRMTTPQRSTQRGATAIAVALTLATGLAAPGPISAQSAPGPTLVKIVGEQHMLALWSDGSVTGWGQYLHAELGPVAGITGRFNADRLVTIQLPAKAIDVAAGAGTSYAVLEDGTVVAWGVGDQGQLGTGPNPKLPLLASSTPAFEYRGMERPMAVSGLRGVVAIVADGASAHALLGDGTVRAWGIGATGDGRAPAKWGDPSQPIAWVPVTVPQLGDVVKLSSGAGTVLALKKDGRVFSWGGNYYGALGRPPRSEFGIDTPGEVPGLTNVVAIAAGLGVSTALKADGTVWVWGSNLNSQFGFGERVTSVGQTHGYELVPAPVPGLANVVEIAVGRGGRQTLARLKDGTLRVWGNNDWGQVGSCAGTGFQVRPIVPKITAVKAVFAAGRVSYAIRTDGSLWAWGGGGPTDWPLPRNVRVPTPLTLR